MDRINEDLERVVRWSVEHELVLNLMKSKFMMLGCKGQIQYMLQHDPKIIINGQRIARVHEANNLGLNNGSQAEV